MLKMRWGRMMDNVEDEMGRMMNDVEDAMGRVWNLAAVFCIVFSIAVLDV